MTRSLHDIPNLDHLKHEAKRLLRSLQTGDLSDVALLRRISRYETSTDDEIQSTATLLEVQQALARDYGCTSGSFSGHSRAGIALPSPRRDE